VPFIYVDDIQRVVVGAVGDGGAIAEAIRPEGHILIAQVRDPPGNPVGVWQFA
jgi:predicted enzyme related to lactoylglutathione lyase